MADSGSFESLLRALTTGNNAIRREAEAVYFERLRLDPIKVIEAQVGVLQHSSDDAMRTIAAVLLRQNLNQDIIRSAAPGVREMIKTSLLDTFAAEPAPVVRRRVAHAIAALASSLPDEDNWPAAVAMAIDVANADDPRAREAGLFLLARVAESIGEGMRPFADALGGLFLARLDASEPAPVAVVAAEACCNFLVHLENKEERSNFERILPPMLDVVGRLVGDGDALEAIETLQSLTLVAMHRPSMFRSLLSSLVPTMLSVSADAAAPENLRGAALELIVTLADCASGAMRKRPETVGLLVRTILQMMCELDEDAELSEAAERAWCEGEYVLEGDPDGATESDAPSIVAEQALTRVAASIGLAHMFGAAGEFLPTLLQASAPWSNRRAAVTAVGLLCAATGSREKATTRDQRMMLLDTVLPYVSARTEPHPRVRHAALGALSHLVEAFATVQKGRFLFEAAPRVLPVLAEAAHAHESGNPPRVCAHAATAILNVCNPSHCKPELVSPHADVLFTALLTLLECGVPSVVAVALTATANVARSCATEFARFYDTFMPGVKSLIGSPAGGGGGEAALVRARAIECLGLLAEAVGHDHFVADAKEVLDVLLSLGSAALRPDDASAGAAVEACARIGTVLGRDFAPYLPVVLPSLIRQASYDIGFSVAEQGDNVGGGGGGGGGGDGEGGAAGGGGGAGGRDEDGGGARGDDDTAAWTMSTLVEVRGVGKIRLSINATATEEKMRAVNMLFQYSDDMGAALGPYVDDIAAVMLPLVNDKLLSSARNTAALTVPNLVLCALQHNRENLGRSPAEAGAVVFPLFQEGLQRLLQQLPVEHDVDTRGALAEAISSTLEAALLGGSDGDFLLTSEPWVRLPGEALGSILPPLLEAAQESFRRRQERAAALEDRDEVDEEAQEALEEELEIESELLTNLTNSMGFVIKNVREAFLPVFHDHIFPVLDALLEPPVPPSVRDNALCTCIDVLEWCGPDAARYIPRLLPILAGCLNDPEELDLRQDGAYGLGILAVHFPESLVDAIDPLLRSLGAVILAPDARDDDHVFSTENAIATLGKVLQHVVPHVERLHPGRLTGDLHPPALWSVYLQQLPLRADDIEARLVHRNLVALAREQHPGVLGDIPQLGRVLGQVLVGCAGGGGGDDALELATPETQHAIALLLRDAHGVVGDALFSLLSPKEMETVRASIERA